MNIVDTENFNVIIPHLGVSLRTIMGAAANAAYDMEVFQRQWGIIYEGVRIGAFQLAYNGDEK